MAKLFAWGANSHGQLGLGYESELCALPEHLTDLPSSDFPANILQISGGGGHCLFLTKDASVYSCGWNNRGQLGVGTTDVESIAKISKISEAHFDEKGVDVKIVRAGWDCSAIIGQAGEIFVWGNNAFQQLGFSKDDLRLSCIPKKLLLPDDERCLDLQFGLRSTVFRTSQHMFVIGSVKLFKCFQDKWPNSTDIVRHNGISFLRLRQDVVHLSVGQNHIAFTTQSSCNCVVQSVGDSRYGLGTEVLLNPEDDGSVIRLLRSGWTHCGVLTDQGDVLLWGRNIYSQIGVDPAATGPVVGKPTKLKSADSIIDMVLGAEHGLVVTNALEVWTWGWNEHGNCGNGSEINVTQPVNVQLPGKCLLAATGAGFCYAVISNENNAKYSTRR